MDYNKKPLVLASYNNINDFADIQHSENARNQTPKLVSSCLRPVNRLPLIGDSKNMV